MKVLLINPTHCFPKAGYRPAPQGWFGFPTGLLSIASAITQGDTSVSIIDALTHPRAQMFRDTKNVYYGIKRETLAELLRKQNPDIVGISCQFATQEPQTLTTAKLVKTTLPHTLVLLGGSNASCRKIHLINSPYVDIVIKGEGEEITKEVIRSYRQGTPFSSIAGILYKDNGLTKEMPNREYLKNLDALPLPAYNLLNMERYLTLYKKGVYSRDRDVKRALPLITSRGCPYGCVFCSIAQTMGNQWRGHSAGYVINHIQTVVKEYAVGHIHFEDDNLLFDIPRFSEILKALHRLPVTWDTPNGIRVDLAISENMLCEMRQSGCKSLTIGVESGDETILRSVIQKSVSLADVEEFARRCKKTKMPLRAFFMLGLPGETRETMRKTTEYALMLMDRYDVEIINHIATPLFGTNLYRICEKNNYFSHEITPQTLAESVASDGKCLIHTPSFSAAEVEAFSRNLTGRVYRKLFIKNLKNPWKAFLRIGNLAVFFRTLKRMKG